jgi:hypothetical protein
MRPLAKIAPLVASVTLATTACEREPMSAFPAGSPTRMVIDAPADRSVGLRATFRWHLSNADPADTYRYEVRFDKGENACDASIEQSFPAESRTCLTIDLSSQIYGGQKVWFGVMATNGKGQTFCAEGRRLAVSRTAAPAASCEVGSRGPSGGTVLATIFRAPQLCRLSSP